MMDTSIVVLLLGLLFIANTNIKFSYGSFSYPDVLCMQRERQALLRFKQGLKDPSNLLSSWSSGEDCCKTWKGVHCHNTTHRVAGLHLRGVYEGTTLGGTLSPSLLDLKYLNYLDLSLNDFGGIRIPKFLGSLENLRYLNLSQAGFYGTIPHQLGNLSSLRYLDLSYNSFEFLYSFSGKLDVENLQWLSRLSSLRYLDLNYVNLTKASDYWLQVINMLPSLSELHLQFCSLYVPLHHTLPHVNFTSLAVLDLSGNSFGYNRMPNWLFSLTDLVSLKLESIGLEGPIPGALQNLTKLRSLDLSSNDLKGEISGFLSGCMGGSLEYLKLSHNQLSGPLPDQLLGQFKNLHYLSLRDNSFSGPIPKSLGSLSKLEILDLSDNPFEGVVSEIHFANLTRLEKLAVDSTSLILNVSLGWIPPFQINFLHLGSVKLSTQLFPAWLHTQKDLYELDLSNSGISDTIPTWFWNLSSQFNFLNLSHNQITGELPKFFMCNDTYYPSRIFLQSNHFEGPLPPHVSPYMDLLNLSNNSFSGPISNFLCNSVNSGNNLQYLDLSENHLSGEIPDCWMDWSYLSIINLRANNFIGNIPSSMGSLLELHSLHLSNNNLSGELRTSFENCSKLQIIDLNENGFSGVIPRWMGKGLPNLLVLGLRSNKFNGGIPQELCDLISLQILDLAHNNLSGSVLQCFSNLSAMATKPNLTSLNYYDPYGIEYVEKTLLVMKGMELEYTNILTLVASMDLSSNNLSGEIPEELTNLLGLISLNLSDNCLTGKIPEKIGVMGSLQSLDFSVNNLSGVIPQSMAKLNFLAFLNLSNNNLSGKIPSSTQLQSFNESSYIGNQGLCGPPLNVNCSRGEASRDSDDGDGVEEGKADHWIEMESYYVSMALGVVVGFWGVFGVLAFKNTWRFAYFRFIEDVMDKVCTLF